MRRLLPLLGLALLALVGWMVFANPGSDEPLIDDLGSNIPSVETPQPTVADVDTTRRTGSGLVEEAAFTNRPLKEGNGRHALGGRVVDEEGEGVPNAWVGAYSSPFAVADFVDNPEELLEQPLALSLDPVASVRADEEGYFDLAGLPGRVLYVTARAPMRLSVGRQRISPDQLGSEGVVEIKTYAAAQLEGTVRDANGNPVPNAEVLVYPGIKYALSALRKRDLFVERTYSDGAGKFAVEAIPAGMVLNASAFAGPTHPGTSEFGPAGRNTGLRTTVELVDLGTLEGQVVNTDDEPVGNVRVAAIPLDLRMVIPVLRNVPGWITSTDGGGNYRFAGLPYGQYLMVAQGDAGRSAPFNARILGPSGNEKTLVLDTRSAVDGRVVDSAGEPIRGATVALMSVPDPEDSGGGRTFGGANQMNFLLEMAREALPELLPPDTEAVTNGQGEFKIAAWRQARVRVSAPGYVTSDYRFRNLPDEKSPVLVLQRPGSVSGRVLRAADEEAVPYFILQPDLRVNALGNHYRSQEAPQGLAAVEEESEPVVVDAGHQHDTAQAPAPAGEPSPREKIEATLADDEHLLTPEAPSLDELKRVRYADDPNGEFKLVGLTPGRWQLRVRADGYETERKTVFVPEGDITEDVEIRLGAGSVLRGMVVDKRDGTPVEAAMVSASNDREGGFTLLAQGFFEGNAVTVSRPDGSFELRGVEDGATWVHVMAEGYASANLQIERVGEGEVRDQIEVELGPGGGITGKVSDRHGAILPRRMVVAFSPGSQDFMQGATDEAGIYTINNLRPGNYLLISVSLDDESLFTGDFMSMLSGGRFVPATVEEGKMTTVDIVDVSAGGCRMSGRLTKNGVPVPGAMLSSIAMGGSGMFDFRMATARTDDNGNFTFKSLAPGEYALNVESSEWGGQLDLFVDDIPEDYVELRVPETVVTGRIVAADSGTALAGVRVRMVREDSPGGMAAMFGGGGWRTRANTDEQGVFTIEGAPSGDYHLIIEPETFGDFDPETQEFEGGGLSYRKTKTRSFFLDEDERVEMDEVQLEAAGAIRVTVLDENGESYERGFQMEATPLSGDTDETFDGWGWSGGGTLAGLPAGTYRLKVEARGYASETQTVSVTAGQVSTVQMTMRAGVDLSVRVLDSSGAANNSALVTVYDEGDNVVHQDAGGDENLFRNFFGGSGDGVRGIGSFAPGRYRVVARDGDRNGDTWVTLQAGQAAVAEVRL